MSQATPQPPPIQPAEWFCIIRGQQYGPMTRDQLVLALLHAQDPGAMVWRPGMAVWAPAGAVPELAFAPASPAFAWVDASFEANRQRRIVRNAKQNAIAMFVVFVVCTVMILGAVAGVFLGQGAPTRGSPVRGSPEPMLGLGCAAWVSPACALFAAIYLPLRWRVINSLSPAYRRLGLIGGFGLIGQLVLGLIALAVAAVFA